MKKIYLNIKNKILFNIYLREYKSPLIVKEINEGLFEINFECTYDLMPISMYLLETVITDLTKDQKNDKLLVAIYRMMTDQVYYPPLITLELDRYFKSSETLEESSFVKFNLEGLTEEVLDIKRKILQDWDSIKIRNMLHESYKKQGIDLNDYSELTVEFTKVEFNLINNKGEKLNSIKLADKFGIEIPSDGISHWELAVNTCALTCIILKVKKLNIPEKYIEFYEDLMLNKYLLDTGILINLGGLNE